MWTTSCLRLSNVGPSVGLGAWDIVHIEKKISSKKPPSPYLTCDPAFRLGYLLSSPSGRKREKINHMFDSGKFFVISSLVFQFLGGLIPTQIMDETAPGPKAGKKLMLKTKTQRISFLYLNLRSSEIHLFYNLGDFYWHFLEILWLFIFLVLYLWSPLPSLLPGH